MVFLFLFGGLTNGIPRGKVITMAGFGVVVHQPSTLKIKYEGRCNYGNVFFHGEVFVEKN